MNISFLKGLIAAAFAQHLPQHDSILPNPCKSFNCSVSLTMCVCFFLLFTQTVFFLQARKGEYDTGICLCLPYRIILLAGVPHNEFIASVRSSTFGALSKKKKRRKCLKTDKLTAFKGIHLSQKMDLYVTTGFRTNENDIGYSLVRSQVLSAVS